MLSSFAKVREIASRYRISPDAVYLWIRKGKIPPDCVVRIAGTVRVDVEQFEHRLRSGALYQARGRKPALGSNPQVDGKPSVAAEDNFTTVRSGLRTEHAWASEDGNTKSEHPFSPEMRGAAK